MTGRETSGGAGKRDGRHERWSAHRVARRAELIEAVLGAVRERGAGIDMDDVAAASGVAKPVFYRYFKDKADLFLAVGIEVGERLVADVVAALDGTRDPRAMISAAVDTFLRAVEDDPQVYRFVLQRPANAATASDYSAVISKRASQLIGDLLRDAGFDTGAVPSKPASQPPGAVLRAAGFDTGAAEPWGFAMVGAVRSAAERWLDEPTMSRSALSGYLTNLMWSGSRRAPNVVTSGGDRPGSRLRSVPRRA